MSIEEVDLVVVGAGPAGLAAAAGVARRGGRVAIIDEAPTPGGHLLSQVYPDPTLQVDSALRWVNGAEHAHRLIEEVHASGARLFCGAAAWGIFPGWYVAVAPVDGRLPGNDVPTGFTTRTLLLATGATESPLPLPGWTLPGVMTATAAMTLVNVHRVVPGKHVVVVGVNPHALTVARLLAAVGVDVRGVLLPPPYDFMDDLVSPRSALRTLEEYAAHAPSLGSALATQAATGPLTAIGLWGIPVRLDRAACAVMGSEQVESIQVAAVQPDGTLVPGDTDDWAVDAVITSAGFSPLIELVQLAGCPVVHISEFGGYVPLYHDSYKTPVPGLYVAGRITGIEGAAVAEAQGRVAGLQAAVYLGLAAATDIRGDLAHHLDTVEQAIQATPYLLPTCQAGRAKLGDHWRQAVQNERLVRNQSL